MPVITVGLRVRVPPPAPAGVAQLAEQARQAPPCPSAIGPPPAGVAGASRRRARGACRSHVRSLIMADPLATVSTRQTPQGLPADPRQVRNDAGGFGFALG